MTRQAQDTKFSWPPCTPEGGLGKSLQWPGRDFTDATFTTKPLFLPLCLQRGAGASQEECGSKHNSCTRLVYFGSSRINTLKTVPLLQEAINTHFPEK